MKCPFCAGQDDRVIDSRASAEGEAIRRRRQCQLCQRRYTTYERVEEVPRLVRKKDSTREPFSRQKILQGLIKACEKRPIALARLEEAVDRVESRINDSAENEVEARFIGELLVEELKGIDQVAYVRFASVYREFADVTEFINELTPLIGSTAGDGARDVGVRAVEGRVEGNGTPDGSPAEGSPAHGARPAEGGEPCQESKTFTADNEAGDRHQASPDPR